MGRKSDSKRIQEIGQYIDQHPGSKPFDIAKGLDLPPSTITRYLPVLEDQGILLSEDNRGRLWPFGKRR